MEPYNIPYPVTATTFNLILEVYSEIKLPIDAKYVANTPSKIPILVLFDNSKLIIDTRGKFIPSETIIRA